MTFFFLYRIVLAATLLVLQALVDLLKNLMLNLAGKSEFLGSLGDGPRWEIEVDLVDDLAQNAFHVGENDGLCQLLSIGLVSSIMLDLDVQVQRALTTVNFLAVLVWTDVLPIYLQGSPAIVLFAGIFCILLHLSCCQGLDRVLWLKCKARFFSDQVLCVSYARHFSGVHSLLFFHLYVDAHSCVTLGARIVRAVHLFDHWGLHTLLFIVSVRACNFTDGLKAHFFCLLCRFGGRGSCQVLLINFEHFLCLLVAAFCGVLRVLCAVLARCAM